MQEDFKHRQQAQVRDNVVEHPGPSNQRKLPEIKVTDRQLREVASDTLAALQQSNNPPCIYVRGGLLVRVRQDENGLARVETLTRDALRGRLTEVADFIEGGFQSKLLAPPASVVANILSRGRWERLPPLEGLTQTPPVRPDGGIHSAPGYDPTTRLIYRPRPGFELPAVPDNPTAQELSTGAALIEEPFVDFPFVDDASRATALSLPLTLVLRTAILGQTPLYLVDAPVAGTGKGLLTDVASVTATGRPATKMAAPVKEEEMVKTITASLLDGDALNVLDEVTGTLKSPGLASVLTTGEWKQRLLGRNDEMIRVRTNAVWAALGNNIKVGGDLPRRCVLCRMDAQIERPWERDGWKHDDLLKWVLDHRAELIAAILTLFRGWCAQGQPVPDLPTIGGFEPWTRVIGGVLHVAGIEGFLDNLERIYGEFDTESTEWRTFLSEWHGRLGEHALTNGELIEKTRLVNLVTLDVLWAHAPRAINVDYSKLGSSARSLGRVLASHAGIQHGQFRLEDAGEKSHAKLWRVVRED